VNGSRFLVSGALLLVVLAGCSAPMAGRQAGDSTPGPTGERTTSLDEADFPPGFSRNGVSMAGAREHTLELFRNGTIAVGARERFRPGAFVDYAFAANVTHLRFRRHVHNGVIDVTRRDVYIDPDAGYVRASRNGRVSVRASNATIPGARYRSASGLWAVLSRILVVGEFRATGIESGSHRRRIHYDLTGTIVTDAGDQRGCLVVDGDGVIRQAFLAYTVGGERKRFEYAVRNRSGVAVDRPTWLSGESDDSTPPDRWTIPGETAGTCADGRAG